jgi:hypothetical protein
MKQLANLLRQFADSVESGKQFKGPVHCAVVLGNDKGETQATYIGQLTPPQSAGIGLLASGILNWNNDVLKAAAGTLRRST